MDACRHYLKTPHPPDMYTEKHTQQYTVIYMYQCVYYYTYMYIHMPEVLNSNTHVYIHSHIMNYTYTGACIYCIYTHPFSD